MREAACRHIMVRADSGDRPADATLRSGLAVDQQPQGDVRCPLPMSAPLARSQSGLDPTKMQHLIRAEIIGPAYGRPATLGAVRAQGRLPINGMEAIFSMTARGVSPGARALVCCFSVTCRQ